ncbi:MAG: 5-formyltetrahydrofolate cyclo-ligase [Marmoricola sp.]
MDHIEASKLALRDQLMTARGRLGVAEISRRGQAVTDLLMATVEVRRAATVAAYVSVGREPGTGLLIEALHAAGKRVILPLLQRDNDLDWATYAGPGSLVAARRGLLEPATPALGPEAIATADVVLVPGLAVGRTGVRMGRGGGSYDRALGRVPVGTFTCVVLNDAEVLDAVPTAAHDRAVTAAVTEERLIRFPVG